MVEVGVRNDAKLVAEKGFGHLPSVKGSDWLNTGRNFFKGEKRVLNVGLGQNPGIFNENLINFSRIK